MFKFQVLMLKNQTLEFAIKKVVNIINKQKTLKVLIQSVSVYLVVGVYQGKITILKQYNL